MYTETCPRRLNDLQRPNSLEMLKCRNTIIPEGDFLFEERQGDLIKTQNEWPKNQKTGIQTILEKPFQPE